MAARKTSLTLSEAAFSVVAARQQEGESVSAAVSRLIVQYDAVDRMLSQLDALLGIDRIVQKLDDLEQAVVRL